MIRRPPRSTLFPYTTLFRSRTEVHCDVDDWQTEGRPADFLHFLRACARVSVRLVPENEGSLPRSEEHTSELQSRLHLVCRLLLEKKKKTHIIRHASLHTADG